MKIIINADDCGINKIVNSHIEECILNNKITSTTIIANMDDFSGAVDLYKRYKDRISFGIHLNLTEGRPLLLQPELVFSGQYVEIDGSLFFNMKEKGHRKLNRTQKQCVYFELKAQIELLLKAGIHISHIDSHHHIHTDKNILPIVIRLAKEYNIKKIRGIRNYMPLSTSYILRKCWHIFVKMQYPSVKLTTYFTSFLEFIRTTPQIIKSNEIIELECHPGHPKYQSEEMLLLKMHLSSDSNHQFINYNQL